VLAQVLSRLTEYFHVDRTSPGARDRRGHSHGPATVVLSGISSGLESSVYAVIAIAVTLGLAIALGNGNIQFAFYLVALVGMGMLATTGSWSPKTRSGRSRTTRPASPRCSGEFGGEPQRIMVSLDAVGNTTKAVTKGFAIGSAVIAAVALFASFVETIGNELSLKGPGGKVLEGSDLFKAAATQINVADPKVFIGLLIGGSIAFFFSSLAIRAVGRTAGVVVQEVRAQFADGKIMAGTKEPDYGPVIDICTTASLRELATPALLAVLTPVIIGFGINYVALGGFLAAVILTGPADGELPEQLGVVRGTTPRSTSRTVTRAEGIRRPQGRSDRRHRRRPFKDTAGPALNPLIR